MRGGLRHDEGCGRSRERVSESSVPAPRALTLLLGASITGPENSEWEGRPMVAIAANWAASCHLISQSPRRRPQGHHLKEATWWKARPQAGGPGSD